MAGLISTVRKKRSNMNLKCINVRDDIINQILYDFDSRLIEIDKLEDTSYYEYRKKIIYIKDTKQCIIPGYIINYYCNTNFNSWKQLVCTPAENTSTVVEDSIDGQTAWMCVFNTIRKQYSYQEFRSILQAYGDTKGNYVEQFHYTYPNVSQNVRLIPLCVKYDINGAHGDAICEMFPKSKQDLMKLYHRNKKYINFFVGMLKRHGYIGAYWYIVDRTTKILWKAIDYVGGTLIYANTDGFCVQKPKHKLNVSTELGDFKKEYEGTVYFYSNTKKSPYVLYQFGNEFKGSCITAVRDQIDLSKGKVVYYNRVKHGKSYLPENIEKETIQIDG